MKALLDTSFFFRLLDSKDPLHKNAKSYFEYMLTNDFDLYVSTIAIAEFCVRNPLDHLPLRNLRILPFNVFHAQEAGRIYKLVRDEKEKRGAEKLKREVVQNDSKQFGQAVNETFDWYVSSDSEALKVYDIFKDVVTHRFEYIDINTPFNLIIGELFQA